MAHPEKKDLPQVEGEAAFMETEEVMQVEASQEKRYAFLHHTTQEVAYDTLLFTQRQRLHRAVAEALAEPQPDAMTQIAYHAYAGEQWTLALRYNLLAGKQAQQLHATQQGIDFFQKALKSAGELPEMDTVEERKRVHLALGDYLLPPGGMRKSENI